MPDTRLNKTDCLAHLPPEWPQDLLPAICNAVTDSRTKIVILDDDPTGTQTVHNVPVLTTWDRDSLETELKGPAPAFFILTNSRALTRPAAVKLGQTIGSNLKQAAAAAGTRLSIISRSDSTLRGHFPHEVDAVATVLGQAHLPYLICPFFAEGGRYTMDDVHYVAEGNQLVPAAQTPYARDASFGFSHSNLCRWVQEKTGNRISADTVVSISLDHIRKEGPDGVAQRLLIVPDKGACIVNAVSYRDMEVVVQGLVSAAENGRDFLYRTAASFVRVRAGITPRENLLSKKELVADRDTGGLFIVGSYVTKTTAQVHALLENTQVVPIKINVQKVLEKKYRDREIQDAVLAVNHALENGRDTMVYTSRDLVVGNDSDTSLKIGQAVSASLIQIIQGLTCQPRYLLAKGGITSSDVATQGLHVKRAMISGQALPGVPVWTLGPESALPGMSYIVFPGNVGTDDALVTLQKKLS